MARGGYREGAGAKFKWIRGKTTVVRVPEVLTEEVLRIAHLLDEGKIIDDITKSKYLDLSGVSIRLVDGQSAVFLKDLVKAGFKLRPFGLQDSVRKQADKLKQNV